ncbi:PH domain-containing protein [Winogradskyella vidalii]|uniref:PH domain-containing protein n=1 Tax=Winogradskyella vidalii TaxID=2615024 RepID=UPI0015C8AB14|nr:PH domain-containing protein [Winogradskyella vidalii]
MNIFTALKDESILLKIKKKTEVSFWEYHFLGLFSFFYNRDSDYLIITNKRIVCIIKEDLIKNVEYKELSSMQFNANNNNLYFKNKEGKKQMFNLNKFRPSYEDIQKIKKLLSQD